MTGTNADNPTTNFTPDTENVVWAGKALHDFVCRYMGEAGTLVDFLGLILDKVYNGIIVCDRNCRIVFMNQVYADLLKTDREKALGKPIQEYFPRSRLGSVMETGRPELGQRCSLKTETDLLVNRIPLVHEGRVAGVILQTIFRDYKSFTDLIGKLNLLEHEVRHQRRALDTVLSPKYSIESIIGRSKPIEEAKVLAMRYARTDAPVLILGATGTGKELFAHAVHSGSLRNRGPFVCLNCAGIPKDLLESELFGYESGAFTGARKEGKPGQIEIAHQGTLYLDEIGELPLSAQAKLLRVLENKVLTRVGAVKPKTVDFRLIAATNRNLSEMMARGDFREDLYYRLNAMTVSIPHLSERTDDLPILVRHFLAGSDKSHIQLTDEAMSLLKAYKWPGNVRELKNVIDRALSLADGDTIEPGHLPFELPTEAGRDEGLSENPYTPLAEELARCEKRTIIRTLNRTKGNMSKTAKILGVSRSTLYEKCRRHGINHLPT